MSNGFIKVSRRMLEWGWYKNINTKIVFLHLLLKASFKRTMFEGHIVRPGQCVISVNTIAEQLGLTESKVETALKHLKKTGEITVVGTNKHSIITIENWAKYQHSVAVLKQGDEEQNTCEEESNNYQMSTLEECKDCKEYFYDCSNTINGTRLYPTEPIDITDEELQQLVEERTVEL